MKNEMKELNEHEMSQINGGDGALTVFGAQLASDGFTHANSSNPVLQVFGLGVASAGGWLWAFGSLLE